MKLELKHITPYFEHQLMVRHFDDERELLSTCELVDLSKEEATLLNSDYEYYELIEDLKPYLHPLSDLTKEIEIKGEVFAPIPRLGYDDAYPKPISQLLEDLRIRPKILPYILLERLFEWHFDVFGLIERGLAIDINTLNKKSCQ